MIAIGIDAGVHGALAAIERDGVGVTLHDVPTRKGKRGLEYVEAEMVALLLRFEPLDAYVVLEEAQIRPGESGPSALKIGKGWGIWRGILAALKMPYETVHPAVWKKQFSLVGCDKKASRARAQELFPRAAADLAKKRPDFSEALLLAEYGRRRITSLK